MARKLKIVPIPEATIEEPEERIVPERVAPVRCRALSRIKYTARSGACVIIEPGQEFKTGEVAFDPASMERV